MESRPTTSPDLPAASRARDPGPAIVAVPFRHASSGRARTLLSPRERAELARISAFLTVRKGEELYREGEAAEFMYIVTNGYVRTQRAESGGVPRVTAFRSAGDLLGLAAEGHYVESAQAIATSSAYRVPLGALEALLHTDGELSLRLLCKLSSVVVAEQRHAMILARTGATGRVAMFLETLEQAQRERGRETELIFLPMSRADIAAYVGLSLEAVSRALSNLQAQGAVSFRTKRQLRVTDRRRLQELIAGRRQARRARAR